MKEKRTLTMLIIGTLLIISFLNTFSTIPCMADPANQPPELGSASPGNSTTGNWWDPPPYGEWIPWHISINDPEGDRLSWSIQCSNGQSSTGSNAFNGSIYLKINSPLNYATTYKVWVNVTDPLGSGIYTRGWYTFTTKINGNNPPALTREPNPSNGSNYAQLTQTWSIRINDLEGNPITWSLQCSNGQVNSSTGDSNGTKRVSLTGLTYATNYKVWVNATDPAGSGQYLRKWFTFTTKANGPPEFDDPILLNNSIGTRLSFNWRIPISDSEGNPFSWTIQCSNGQGTSGSSASNGTKALSLSSLTASTTYTVWVNATDPTGSGLWTREWYTFTTQGSGGNNPPVFGTPTPLNISSGNRLVFPWSIPISDPQGTYFTWTIQCNNGQTTYVTNATNGTKTLYLSDLAYSTTYKIWVNATDPYGSNTWTRRWYTVSTESIFPVSIPTAKSWSPITSATGETRVGLNIADINNDGRMEIIRSGINGIVVYDGITGAIVWSSLSAMWDSHIPLEITDVNKDGYLDVISSYDTGTRALSGDDGSVLWYTSNAPSYNKHLVVGDIGTTSGSSFVSDTPDGYPEIFVCAAGAEDGSPQGKITALTHTGAVFATAFIYFPCYGGLSLGDTNHDGTYELYLCERNIGYDGNTVGKGVAAFWASNLTLRWSHPEMLSSSHCPTLVDTNKDGILDIVALAQTGGNGIAVYNASDGSVIHFSSIPGLRCHSQPTIYDIDGDGNLEIIAGGGSDSWGKPVIWDLYTWTLEAWLPYNCWEPPAIADLDGDGRVEIIECTITNISIFDDNYKFRGSIPLDNNRSGDGWYGMSMIVAQDIDNDGLIELVLNRNTRIYAYETDGVAPTPRAESQYMYYSPLRGRYPYSSPYRDTAPLISNENPANQSTNIPFNPQLSVYAYDNQQDTMDITFQTNATTGSWHTIQTYNDVSAGTYTSSTTGMNASTTYYWWSVTVTDSTNATSSEIFKFRTINGGPNEDPYTPNTPFPSNTSSDNPITTDLSWTGGDPNGDTVTYDVYFGTSSPPSKVSSNQSATSYDPPGDLAYNTTYYWKIVAWDTYHANATGPIWEFSTGSQVNSPPNPPNSPNPANGATKKAITTKLYWNGGDPDGDPVTYDVYFGTSTVPDIVSHNQTALNYNPGTLAYDTTYYWVIVAWDNHGASARSTTFDPWNFTTKSYSSGGGGGTGGGSSEEENIKPIAKASTGGAYHGYINQNILFDGSTSSDEDGNITTYSWNFGDNTTGSGKTIQHAYTNTGTYTVTLTVTDNGGETDTDTTTCVITRQNRLPTAPHISGPTNGTKNVLYTYTASSTDADNNTLRYTFTWGDSISAPESSGFEPNGTTWTINHSWTAAGRYKITVTVQDNQENQTVSSNLIVYIDAKPIGSQGYLLDNNSDGTFDAFYSDSTHHITPVQKNGGNYTIDTDGNGEWDLSYNELNGTTAPYEEIGGTPGFDMILLASIVIIIGAIVVVLFLLWNKRKK
jgi:hypothetical protein